MAEGKHTPLQIFSDMALLREPYSSVVGQSLTIIHPRFGVVANLIVLVPQSHINHRAVGEAVADALMRGHVSKDGVTLVLPADFAATGDRK